MNLDDAASFSQVDPEDFLGVIETFPRQMQEGLDLGLAAANLPSLDGVTSVAVLGMGGSGISGDFLRAIVLPRSPVHVETVRGYEVPNWVGPSTLVFAASYSGNTEETLQSFELARSQGATKAVIISSGGSLVDRANELDLPVVRVPSGLQPRAALGYLAVPMLVIWDRLSGVKGDENPGITKAVESAIALAEKRSRELGRGVPVSQNAAKDLAQKLVGKIPIVYGTEGSAEVAAYRWKCQLNECAKVPAYHHNFPELNHNEIVGWNRLKDLTGSSVGMVILRHRQERPRIQKRVEVTVPLIANQVSFIEQVHSEGATDVERLFDHAYFGDFVATYLAIAQDVDPTPVDVIEDLKRQIASL